MVTESTTYSGQTYPVGYDYDSRGRLVEISYPSGRKAAYSFDIRNELNINLNGNNTARTFNNIHALTAIGSDSQTFDVDGNLTTSHAGHTLDWDEAGFLKEATVPSGSNFGIEGVNEYGYDATQKRVYKKIFRNESLDEHTVYIYAGPNCIAEYPAGTTAASPTQEYVYAQEIDSLVLLVRGGGSDKYTITRNQQWSVTALAELASGTIVERYTYDHFGKRTILEPNGTSVRSVSSYGMPYGYTSRRHDAETDLMYFRARYYNPHTAEFLSPDPLEYVDGMSLFRGYFAGVGVDPSGLATHLCNCTCYRRRTSWTAEEFNILISDEFQSANDLCTSVCECYRKDEGFYSCHSSHCEDPIIIKVYAYIWKNSNANRSIIANQIKKANQIWRACCIRFQLEEIVDVDKPAPPRGDIFNVNGVIHEYIKEQNRAIQIHYINLYANVDGARISGGIFMKNSSHIRTLAHELGHFFLLPHLNTRGSLMHEYVNQAGDNLSDNECKDARTRAAEINQEIKEGKDFGDMYYPPPREGPSIGPRR